MRNSPIQGNNSNSQMFDSIKAALSGEEKITSITASSDNSSTDNRNRAATNKLRRLSSNDSTSILPGISRVEYEDTSSRVSSTDTQQTHSIVDITDLIKSSGSLFSHATDQFIQDLEKRMNYRYLQPGDYIIREGEVGKAMFFIIRGTCVVSSKDGDSIYAELGPGKYFGEIGVLFEVPRTANVIAKTRVVVAALTRSGLAELLPVYPEISDELSLEAEERYEILVRKSKVPPRPTIHSDCINNNGISFMYRIADFQYYIPRLLDTLHSKNGKYLTKAYNANEIIMQNGQINDMIHFLVQGSVNLVEDSGAIFGRLPEGTFFGDSGVMNSLPNIYSYLSGSTGCLIISATKDQLSKLFHEYPAMKQRIERSAQRNKNFYMIIQRRANGFELRRKSTSSITALSGIIPSATESGFTESTKKSTSKLSLSLFDNDSVSSASSSVNIHKNQTFNALAPLSTSGISDDNLRLPKTPESEKNKRSNEKIANMSNVEEEDDDEDDESPLPAMPKHFNPAIRFDTQKRRASVAVWADSKLSEFAAQHTAKAEEPKNQHNLQTKFQHATISTSSQSINSIGSSVKSAESILNISIGPAGAIPVDPLQNPEALELIFLQLPLKTLWKLRQVCKPWKLIIENSHKIMRMIDLSPYHKEMEDDIIEKILSNVKGTLEVLVLKNCWKLTNNSLRSIATHCRNLEMIDLCGCWDITDDGITALALGCKGIKSIDLSNCRKISDRGILSLMSTCTNLVDIFLSYCKALSDAVCGYMKDFCPNIRRVNLQRCLGITDIGIEIFGTAMHTRIQELILSDCSFLTDSAMRSIALSCQNLKILNLSFCCALTEEGLLFILQGCLRLNTLDASFCGSAVSDEVLEVLSKRLVILEKLSVRGCARVTDVGVNHLIRHGAKLKQLNISNCKGTSSEISRQVPNTIRLLDAHESIIDNSGITGCDNFGSNHLRRYTSP